MSYGLPVQRKPRRQSAEHKKGRPVGADSAKTRQRVIRAGREVLNERGYAAMTFQAISRHTGLSRPTLHYYFPTREDLYEAIADEAREIVAECVAEAMRHDTLLDRFSAFFAAVRGADRRDGSVIAFLISARLESHRNAELHEPEDSPIRVFLTELVTDAVKSGELAPDTDVAAIATVLHVSLWGLGCYASFLTSPADLSTVTKQLFRMFAHGLLADDRDTAPSGVSGAERRSPALRDGAGRTRIADTPRSVGRQS